LVFGYPDEALFLMFDILCNTVHELAQQEQQKQGTKTMKYAIKECHGYCKMKAWLVHKSQPVSITAQPVS